MFSIFRRSSWSVPSELDLRKEIFSLRDLINTIDDERARLKRLRELNFKLVKLPTLRNRPLNMDVSPEYQVKLISRLTDSDT